MEMLIKNYWSTQCFMEVHFKRPICIKFDSHLQKKVTIVQVQPTQSGSNKANIFRIVLW